MRHLPLPALLLLAALSITACDKPEEKAPPAAPAPADARTAGAVDRSHAQDMAPDVAFRDPDGGVASLSDFRGRPLLVNLWATWCAPCVKELPTLDALAARTKGDLRVLTISQDMGAQEKVAAFLAAKNLRSLEAWQDAEMGMSERLGAATLPTTVLFDSQGREVWRVTGDRDWGTPESRALVAEAR